MSGRRWNRTRPTVAQLLAVADEPFVPDEESWKLFNAHKAEAEKRQLASIDTFDKSILAYSSAGLGLSLTFLKDFVPLWQASYTLLLYISWGLFVLATVLTIFSFLISASAQERSIDDADKCYLRGDVSVLEKKYWQNTFIRYSNRFAGAAFVSALVLSSVFVGVNAEVRRFPSSSTSKRDDAAVVQFVYEAGNFAGERAAPPATPSKKIVAPHTRPAKSAQESIPVDQVLCK